MIQLGAAVLTLALIFTSFGIASAQNQPAQITVPDCHTWEKVDAFGYSLTGLYKEEQLDGAKITYETNEHYDAYAYYAKSNTENSRLCWVDVIRNGNQDIILFQDWGDVTIQHGNVVDAGPHYYALWLPQTQSWEIFSKEEVDQKKVKIEMKIIKTGDTKGYVELTLTRDADTDHPRTFVRKEKITLKRCSLDWASCQ